MLIALGHKARQGKDTAAEAIVEFYNRRRANGAALVKTRAELDAKFPEARVFHFADELYRVCREEYGMIEKDAPLLQKIGNGRREAFGAHYWIDMLADKVRAFKGIAVISDMRYTNEADWVKLNGGHTINVRRLNVDGTPYIATDRDPLFISEVQLDHYGYDHYIVSKSAALTAEIAITIAEFVRGLETK